MTTPSQPPISSCCKSPMSVSTADEGTSFYVCSKCGKACNAFEERLPGEIAEEIALVYDTMASSNLEDLVEEAITLERNARKEAEAKLTGFPSELYANVEEWQKAWEELHDETKARLHEVEEELDGLKQKLAICHDKNTDLKNIINGLNQEVCATCSIYKMKNEALEEELRRAGEALKNGHKAIDIAMAMLIEKDSNFYPSKSVLWPLLLKVHQALKLSNLKRLMEKK